MDEITISQKMLVSAAATAGLEEKDAQATTSNGRSTLRLSGANPRLLEAILLHGKLKPAQRAAVRRTLGVSIDTAVLDAPVESLVALRRVLVNLVDEVEPTLEFDIGGKSYPIFVEDLQQNTLPWGTFLTLRAGINISLDGTLVKSRMVSFSEDDFIAPGGGRRPMTSRSLLAIRGLRPSRAETLERWKKHRSRAKELSLGGMGKVFVSRGSALSLESQEYWKVLVVSPAGTAGRCVVEPSLELDDENTIEQQAETIGYKHLQFVRVFGLTTKRYYHVDVEDLVPYEFDEKARDRLVLPAGMMPILNSLFDWDGTSGFSDIFADRHGGVVVLAEGPPGVGKTLTAEVYSHTTKRPLYSIDLSELGTTTEKVEESLRRIFTRVVRWNAVLLLDEADIFMAKRTKEELERSAIVGVFLRVLDQYRGTLFLTSNRAEVMDDAFASRITLRLQYPKLDGARRATIWRTMLLSADFSPAENLSKLFAKDLNGRQIRNAVRLARIVYPRLKSISEDQLMSIVEKIV